MIQSSRISDAVCPIIKHISNTDLIWWSRCKCSFFLYHFLHVYLCFFLKPSRSTSFILCCKFLLTSSLAYLLMILQVADFGLAKIASDSDTHVSTRVMGTFGYASFFLITICFVFWLVYVAWMASSKDALCETYGLCSMGFCHLFSVNILLRIWSTGYQSLVEMLKL